MSRPKELILVVDDDPRWLQRIEAILEPDYEVQISESGDEALTLLKDNPISLVVLDMKLANGASGLEVFQRMQQVAANLPAIMLTGYPERSSMRSSFKQGIMDYLEKDSPNLDEELRGVVADMIAKRGELDLRRLISAGESQDVEFKTSVRWDSRNRKVNKELERTIVKTIAGFLNSEQGGKLLIGVGDGGEIVGIEQDYPTLARKDRDGYEGYLTKLLLDTFGKDLSLCLRIGFHELEHKTVCQVATRPSPKAVYVIDQNGEHLYVRTGNSTRKLTTREAVDYYKIRWKG